MIKQIKKIILVFLYRGNRYLCPICGYKAKQLYWIGQNLPVLRQKQVVGSGLRRGGCYNCGSRDRERLVYAYLKEKLNIFTQPKKYRVLHLAPENRLSAALLKSGLNQYVCGDLFAPGYSYPSHVQNMNVLNIPYAANYFDLIICNHVLEHVPQDLKAMKELYRVLKPGGQTILQVPISKNSLKTFEDFTVINPEKRKVVFGQFDHVRIYGQDYPSRLKQAGFRVKKINLFPKFSRYGLNPDEKLYIGLK